MMVSRPAFSNGINWWTRMVLVGVLGLAPMASAWAWGPFIRTPAESMAAQPDLIPPYLLGFPLDNYHPTYYGGLDYTRYYGYGRGWGPATFIYNMPNSVKYPIPDKQIWFTSYPYTGDIYFRYGPQAGKAAPPPVSGAGPVPVPGQVPQLAPADPVGRFQVEVPDGATVWIEDRQMTQTGPARIFVSPPLVPGKTYLYDIRARWEKNGKATEQKQTISVQAGSSVKVRFPTPEQLKPPKSVPEGE